MICIPDWTDGDRHVYFLGTQEVETPLALPTEEAIAGWELL